MKQKIFKRLILLLSIIIFSLSCTSISKSEIKENRLIKTKFGNERVDGNTYTSKGQNFRVRFIILHYTVANKERSIDLLTNQEVSSHYLISDNSNDPIYYLVDENKRAWHAGQSNWGNFNNLNDNSIGIEIVNSGFKIVNDTVIFSPYSSDQVHKVAVLLLDVIERYNIDPKNILGHSDIAPQRKQDPGPMFPWKELYEQYNIGIWYDTKTKEKFMTEEKEYDIKIVQEELKKFGYSINVSGTYDEQTKNVISAFQYRFRPSKYNGVADKETISILKALNEKYK